MKLTSTLYRFLFVFALLLSLSTARAQYVAIPDTNFGYWLNGWNYYCMTGNSHTGWFMDTTCSGLTTPLYGQILSITNANISNFDGLQYFKGYGGVDLSGNKLTKPPFQFINTNSFSGYYAYVILNNNLIDTLDLLQLQQFSDNSPADLIFYCNNNKIAKVVPDTAMIDLSNVIELDLSNNRIDTLPLISGKIDLSGFTDLVLSVRNNHLRGTLDARYCHDVDAGVNQLTSITFGAGTATLTCDSNQIASINYGSTIITYEIYAGLNCSYNNLVSFPSTVDSYKFGRVNCSHNHIASLPDMFNDLNCSYNNISSLPPFENSVYGYPAFLDCSYNPFITCLPAIPATDSFYLNASNTSINCVPNRFSFCNYTGPTPVSSYPLCGLVPSSPCQSYTSLEGVLYHDSLASCTLNNAESRVCHYPVSIYKNGQLQLKAFSFDNGYYGMSEDTGFYYLQADSQYADVFTIHCPVTDSFDVQVRTADTSISHLDFGFECASGFDLEVGLGGMINDHVRSGSTNLMVISAGDHAKDFGVSCIHGIGGTVRMIKHGTVAQYAPFTSIYPYVISGDTLTWTVPDFGLVNNEADFIPQLQIDSAARSGTQICIDAYITPVAGDKDSTNNHSSYCLSVDNSYDPNYKTVSPEGNLPNTGVWLTYTVHFQNTGNDTAHNIHIADTIDTRYLDLSSLQYLRASSACYMVEMPSGALRFDLPGIDLTDSLHDEPKSIGWVQYRIRTKPNLTADPLIKNTAYIYFDFNDAVATNSTFNYICTTNDTFILRRYFCTGDSFAFGGRDISVAGVYVDSALSVGGCDSITILYLTQHPVIRDTIRVRQCFETEYYFNRTWIYIAGTYSDTATGINGCDSITTLVLDFYPPHYIDTITVYACDTNLYMYHGYYFDYSGHYDIPTGTTDSFTCGIYHLLRLTFVSTIRDTTHQTICYGDSLSWRGKWISISGAYSDTLTSWTGCDSIATLVLGYYSTGSYVIGYTCPGSYYSYHGSTFAFGYHSITLPYASVFGCDSSVYLNVLVDSLYPGLSVSTQACDMPDTLIIHGVSSARSIQWMLNGIMVKSVVADTGAVIIGSQAGYGQFIKIKSDALGNKYILSLSPDAIIKVNTSGAVIASVSLAGYSNGYQYAEPGDIALDSAGNVYEINNEGDILRWPKDTFDNSVVRHIGGFYPSLNDWAVGMAIDKAGNIYASNNFGNDVLKYTGSSTNAIIVAGGNGYGTAANQLRHPRNICIDSNGNLFVADDSGLKKFPPGSTSATNAITVESYISVSDIYVNASGEAYTLIDGGQGVNKFALNNLPDTIGTLVVSSNTCRGNLNMSAFTVDPNGAIFTVQNNTLMKWFPHPLDTTFIASTRGSYYVSVLGCECELNSDTMPVGFYRQQTTSAVCPGSTYSFGSRVLTLAGSYLDTFSSIGGCDSIVQLSLTTLSVLPAAISQSGGICAGADTIWLAGNNLYDVTWMRNASTAYIDTYASVSRVTTVAGGNGMGAAANQLNEPENVFVDSLGNVYTGDWLNYRVQKWAPGSTSGITVAGGNGYGNAANQLGDPWGVYVDNSGNVYVSDGANDRIQLWTSGSTSGITVAGGNGNGSLANQFNYPAGIFVDRNKNIYVVDLYNNRVQKWMPGATIGITVAGGNGQGNASDQFAFPEAIFVDTADNIYVADAGNNRIQEWARDSIYGITVAGQDTSLASYLGEPNGVYVDRAGEIYVSDNHNNGIQRFSPGQPDAVTVAGGTGAGSGMGQFDDVAGVWLDNAGNIYAADLYNNRIQKWQNKQRNYIAVSSGDYWATFVNSDGCVSVSDTLHVITSTTVHIDSTICAGSTVTFNGEIISQSGIYADTFIRTSGCDSIISLSLSVLSSSRDTTTATICGGSDYTFAGHTMYTAGTYADTVHNSRGCDSIISLLNLTVISAHRDTNTVTICAGSSYTFASHSINIGGTYADTIQNLLGCDSIISVLHLNVISPLRDTTTVTICAASSYTFAGHSINTAGTYVDTIQNSSGCDSIISVLNLTVINSHRDTTTATICAGSSYPFAGHSISMGGTYADTIPGVFGCDSIISVLNLTTVLYGSTTTASICEGGSYPFAGHSITTAGIYTDSLQSAQGCDSIDVLRLTVLPLPAPVINVYSVSSYDSLTTDHYQHYQWVKDGLGSPADTLPYYLVSVPPSVQINVIVADSNGCTGTSAATGLIWIGIHDINDTASVLLYPNPNTGTFTLQTAHTHDASYSIYDMIGNLVAQRNIVSDHEIISLPVIATGVYTLIVRSGTMSQQIRFTIE